MILGNSVRNYSTRLLVSKRKILSRTAKLIAQEPKKHHPSHHNPNSENTQKFQKTNAFHIPWKLRNYSTRLPVSKRNLIRNLVKNSKTDSPWTDVAPSLKPKLKFRKHPKQFKNATNEAKVRESQNKYALGFRRHHLTYPKHVASLKNCNETPTEVCNWNSTWKPISTLEATYVAAVSLYATT